MSIFNKRKPASKEDSAKPTNMAIAYNMAKRSKMARGGIVPGVVSKHLEAFNSGMKPLTDKDNWDERDEAASKSAVTKSSPPHKDSGIDAEIDSTEDRLMDLTPASPSEKIKNMADGGRAMLDPRDTADSTDSDTLDMVASIMHKRKMMAEGGTVDLTLNSKEGENEADEFNLDAAGKENYSESDGLDDLTSPMDSNEHGDDIDSDEHDMVSKIRSKLRLRK